MFVRSDHCFTYPLSSWIALSPGFLFPCLTMSLTRTPHAFTLLFLTFCCCSIDADPTLHRVVTNRQARAHLDELRSRQMRKDVGARFGVAPSGSNAESLIGCIALSAYETLDMQQAPRRRKAVIEKICSRQRVQIRRQLWAQLSFGGKSAIQGYL